MRKPSSSSNGAIGASRKTAAKTPIVKRTVAGFVAAALGLSAGAAFAQTATANTQDLSTPGSDSAHLRLTNQNATQTLHYAHARDLRVCNLTGQLAPASTTGTSNTTGANATAGAAGVNNAAGRAPALPLTNQPVPTNPGPTPVALNVSYGSQTEQVQPGNCYQFRARNVSVTLSHALPAGSALDVSLEPVSAKNFRNGTTESASAYHLSRSRTARNAANGESIKQLSDQLKREDQEMRQANAELRRARTKLAETTRELQRAQSQERHVASAERQTAQGEQQEQQSAESAQRR